ncbi:MAG: 50S ribosomal protein L10 [Candidatus Ratteibacteria bacterium]
MKKLTKKRKEEFVKQMSEEIQKNNINLIVGFSGLSVSEMQTIRVALKEKGCKMRVVKNTLLDRVYKQIDCEDMCGKIGSPVFIAWADENDEISILKELYNFQRQFKKTDVKMALIGDKVYSSEELQLIGRLPGKKELEAQIVWILRAPIRKMVNVINAPVLRLINDFKQISEKRKEN